MSTFVSVWLHWIALKSYLVKSFSVFDVNTEIFFLALQLAALIISLAIYQLTASPYFRVFSIPWISEIDQSAIYKSKSPISAC